MAPACVRTTYAVLRSFGRAVSSFVADLLSKTVPRLLSLERAALERFAALARVGARTGGLLGAGLLAHVSALGNWSSGLPWGPIGRVARVAAASLLAATALATADLYHTLVLDPFGLPDLDAFLASGPPTIGRIEDARGEVLAELAREYRRPLEEHELPPVLRGALLAAEDKGFFEHDGVDLEAWPRVIAKVAGASHAAGRVALPQGGSTLTQQLVRVAFLGDWCGRESAGVLLVDSVPNRALAWLVGVRAANKARRKLEEIRLALWLEDALAKRLGSRRKAKQEILRRYALYVYVGEGRYGFAAASEHYLGRPLASLRDDEADLAAVLAGIVKSPSAYSPVEANRTRVLRRRNQILQLMERAGYLAGPARARLERAPLPSRPPHVEIRPDATAAVNWVLESLPSLEDPTLTSHALYDGRIRVGSTIDGRLQRIVAEALENGLHAYERRHPTERARIQGSAVVLANEDARILALVGGRMAEPGSPLRFRDFNRATMSRRQAGSTMKPLVYFTALRLGMTLDSPVLDEPVWLKMGYGRPPKQVSNYDGTFKGMVSLRRALAESRNAATVRLAAAVGVPAIVETAHELGIHSELQPYITTALGASEVTLLELANVYRGFASGRHAEPWIVRSVRGRDGSVLYSRHAPRAQPLGGPALPLIQEALRGTIRLPSATGRALASLPFAVMGKTGTTNDFRDALFVGTTYGPAGITVAVRIGFDDNRSLGEGETGGRAALPVFREVVTRAYTGGVLGEPPAFPEALERGIDRYLAARARPPQQLMTAQVAATLDATDALHVTDGVTFTPAIAARSAASGAIEPAARGLSAVAPLTFGLADTGMVSAPRAVPVTTSAGETVRRDTTGG
jgi:penicillin-binding protein 1A